MLASALMAFLHHLAAFVLFATLVLELVLVRGELTLQSARKLLRADTAFGAAAAVILIVGALRVMYFEKGATYYMHSAPFMAKIGLFVAIGLISIYPTLTFLSWRKSLAQGQLPVVPAGKLRIVGLLIHIELILLAVLILCAALMAKGVGVIAAGATA